MQGEKIVAAATLSRLSDRFHGQWLMIHVPFTDPKQFFEGDGLEDKLALVPKEHRNFAMVLLCEHPVAQETWHGQDGILEELRKEAHSTAFQKTLLCMLEANRALVEKYLAGDADAAAEAIARRGRLDAAGPLAEDETAGLNREQRRLKAKVDEAVDRALAVLAAGPEDDVERLLAEAFDGKIFVCTGGPGTGKTTVALACVHRTLQEGGKVLFVYPTNRQASRMRTKLPAEVEVNTYHAGFGLEEEPGAMAVSLSQYALIVVDEISQMQGQHFDHVRKLWNQADNLPVLLLAGDEMQIAGFGEQRAWQHPMWKTTTYRVKLHQVYRCKDTEFNKILQELRTSRPKASTLKWLQKKKAWTPPGKPTVEGIRKLFKAHPETVVLTCRREGAFQVNEMALEALFPRRGPAYLATVDADVEANPANWHEGILKDVSELVPLRLSIFKGARVCFTRNVRKDIDYVNGMDAEVVGYHAHSKAIEVMTVTGHRVMVWPWSDPDLEGLTFYPLKSGYADTIRSTRGRSCGT